MAKAVIEIFGKEVQYAIGPEIEDGCYYDFILPRAVTEEDFPAIEEKMHEIIKSAARTGLARSFPGMKHLRSSRVRSSRQNSFRICLRAR